MTVRGLQNKNQLRSHRGTSGNLEQRFVHRLQLGVLQHNRGTFSDQLLQQEPPQVSRIQKNRSRGYLVYFCHLSLQTRVYIIPTADNILHTAYQLITTCFLGKKTFSFNLRWMVCMVICSTLWQTPLIVIWIRTSWTFVIWLRLKNQWGIQ